jgi:hypothetical protein
MSDGALQRTQYWNVTAGTVRTGATGHGESLTDVESYVVRLDRARGTGLFSWGVAEGLGVTAVAGAVGVTVGAGSALDAAGRLVVLIVDGTAVVDPSIDPAQILDVPTVLVSADGVELPTAGPATDLLVTLTWREVQGESTVASAPVLLHAPWLRLVPADGFADAGDQVVLARVSVDDAGQVLTLAPGPRRATSVPAGALRLRVPSGTGPALAVSQVDAAELAPDPGGGVRLDLLAGGRRTALSIDGAGATHLTGALTVDSAAKFGGQVTAAAAVQVGGSLTVSGAATLASVTVGGAAVVGGPLAVNGTAELEEVVAGSADVRGSLTVSGAAELAGLSVTGAAQITGPLVVTDAVRLDSAGGASYATLTGADGRWHLRDTAAGADRLYVDQAGNLGIGLGDVAAQRIVHVEGSEVHSGGGGGGFSFADRSTGTFVDGPDAGQRWVWYALNGAARLWSNGDRISVSASGEGGGLDVSRRMRVRQGGDASAGIWFWQNGLRFGGIGGSIGRRFGGDCAFVGMKDNNTVGFWGNTGVGWGLTMDTGNGNVDVVGTLTVHGTIFKQGGGFRIDHPLAPQEKYLAHSFVESPEMATLYTGTAVTDADGLAVVELPDYFAALNTDPRVQLTTVGALTSVTLDGPVAGGRFTIRTGEPGITVAWLVTGTRADEWAEANRIVVESDKERWSG